MIQQIALPPPPTAPSLLCADVAEKKLYWDRSHYDSPESQTRALAASSTLYIGNLAFSTRVSHLKAAFSKLGPVREINMGIDRYQKTPCGFAFVEYVRRDHALSAVAYLSGTKVDGKVIRVELDAGFKPGRQYGRGSSGGQVRDDRRGTVDPKRRTASATSSISRRWQAPMRSPGASAGNDPSGGYYGPVATSGSKRGRDDYDEDIQPPRVKHSRLAEGSGDEA